MTNIHRHRTSRRETAVIDLGRISRVTRGAGLGTHDGLSGRNEGLTQD